MREAKDSGRGTLFLSGVEPSVGSAAVRIQRAFWLSKACALGRAHDSERVGAAVKIQSLCRAYVTRSMYGPILSKRSPHRRKMFVATRLKLRFVPASAVIGIEPKKLPRRRLGDRSRTRHQTASAASSNENVIRKIQSLFRGWHARITRRRVVEDRAALRIQAFVRRKVSGP